MRSIAWWCAWLIARVYFSNWSDSSLVAWLVLVARYFGRCWLIARFDCCPWRWLDSNRTTRATSVEAKDEAASKGWGAKGTSTRRDWLPRLARRCRWCMRFFFVCVAFQSPVFSWLSAITGAHPVSPPNLAFEFCHDRCQRSHTSPTSWIVHAHAPSLCCVVRYTWKHTSSFFARIRTLKFRSLARHQFNHQRATAFFF